MNVRLRIAVLAGAFAVVLPAPPWAAEMSSMKGAIKVERQTAHYKLDLQIDPLENVFSAAEVATKHPTEGEVMLGGTMAMPGSMDMALIRQLEIHVYARNTGKVITDAAVAIVVTNTTAKTAQDVPIAKMYGITQGVADTHFGQPSRWSQRTRCAQSGYYESQRSINKRPMDRFFMFAAEYLFIAPIIILGVYFFTRKWPAQKQMALFAVPAGLLTYVLGFTAGYLYFDPRPFVVGHFTPLIAHVADNGFPSDHALLVASLATVGMYWNRWLGLSLWALALLVAIARVYVGLHHVTDVAGSVVFALIATSVWHLATARICKMRSPN